MRLLALVSLLVLSGCGILPGSTPAATPTAAPAVAPTAAATSTRPPTAATATAAPKPAETPKPRAANTVYVGNTDGEGVYVRKTPKMDDKVAAYSDGTALTIIGDEVEGDGQHWKHVRTPDGLEGYVPAMYTTDAPP